MKRDCHLTGIQFSDDLKCGCQLFRSNVFDTMKEYDDMSDNF